MNQRANLSAYLSWFVATVFVLFQFFLQSSAGMMVSQWAKTFDISLVGVSNLSAAFFYAYVFMQVPVGLLLDKFNARYVLASASLMVAIGCFLLAHTDDYAIAIIARILMGIGCGFGFVGMLHVSASRFAHQHFALMVSLAETIGMLGVAIGEVILAWIILAETWQRAINDAGIIALVLTVLIFIIVKEDKHYTAHKKNLSIFKALGHAISNKQTWLAGLYGFWMFSIINVFTSLWGVPFLQKIYHLNLHTAARMVAMVFIGIALGTVLTSTVSYRMGRRKPILIFNAIMNGLLMGAVIFCPHLAHVLIYGLLFLSGVFASSYILSFAVTKESVLPAYTATALSLANMIFMSSAFILQPLIGYCLSSHFFHLVSHTTLAYRLAVGIVPVGMLLSVVLVLMMRETYCKNSLS